MRRNPFPDNVLRRFNAAGTWILTDSMHQRFQVLCLDGGGSKGLYSASILARLEEDLQLPDITDCFDLIVGTSTGGIIAPGLACGLRPREIVQFYSQHGLAIFPDGWFARKRHYFRRKYSQGPLQAALQKCLGERRLSDSCKKLVVPSSTSIKARSISLRRRTTNAFAAIGGNHRRSPPPPTANAHGDLDVKQRANDICNDYDRWMAPFLANSFDEGPTWP